jgi:hypothetical protein
MSDDVKMEEQQQQQQRQTQPHHSFQVLPFHPVQSRLSGGVSAAGCASGPVSGRVLQVDNLPDNLPLGRVTQFFAQYGSVKNCKVSRRCSGSQVDCLSLFGL